MTLAAKYRASLALTVLTVGVLISGKVYLAHVRADAVRVAQWQQHDSIAAATIARHDSVATARQASADSIIAAQQDSIRLTQTRVAFLDSSLMALNDTPLPQVHILGDTVTVTDQPGRAFIVHHTIALLLAAQDTAIMRRDSVLKLARTIIGEQAKELNAYKSAYQQLSVAADQRDSALTVANRQIADLTKRAGHHDSRWGLGIACGITSTGRPGCAGGLTLKVGP